MIKNTFNLFKHVKLTINRANLKNYRINNIINLSKGKHLDNIKIHCNNFNHYSIVLIFYNIKLQST